MNKKLICTLMAGTLLVGTVTGCGSSSEENLLQRNRTGAFFFQQGRKQGHSSEAGRQINETHVRT